MAEEKKISPTLLIIPIGLGLAAVGVGVVLLFTGKQPPIPPADITLSNLVISPAVAYIGELVSISVTVTNLGETEGSYEVNCEVTK